MILDYHQQQLILWLFRGLIEFLIQSFQLLLRNWYLERNLRIIFALLYHKFTMVKIYLIRFSHHSVSDFTWVIWSFSAGYNNTHFKWNNGNKTLALERSVNHCVWQWFCLNWLYCVAQYNSDIRDSHDYIKKQTITTVATHGFCPNLIQLSLHSTYPSRYIAW